MSATPAKEEKKHLHVQVAEALGWHRIASAGGSILLYAGRAFVGHPPGPFVIGSKPVDIPYYYEDWNATGPLIEERKICLVPLASDAGWVAWVRMEPPAPDGKGKTPLEAVCRLIVALHEAGKL